MIISKVKVLLVILAILFLFSCNNNQVTVNETNFCSLLAEARCKWIRSCCEYNEIMKIFQLNEDDSYSTEIVNSVIKSDNICRFLIHSDCESKMGSYLDSVKSKRAIFISENVRKCLSRYEQASKNCDIGMETSPDWDNVCKVSSLLKGSQSEGDICADDYECQDGLICWKTSESGPGFCVPKSEKDKPCINQRQCETDSYCSTKEPGMWCYKKPIQNEGRWCAKDGDCDTGLFCDLRNEKCTKKFKEGDDCRRSTQCVSEDCDISKKKCKSFLKIGDLCINSNQCGGSAWCNPLFGINICQPAESIGNVGDECGVGAKTCDEHLRCINGICNYPKLNGEQCSTSYECSDEGYCDKKISKCVSPRKGLNEQCYESRDCMPYLFCNTEYNKCKPRLDLNDDCSHYPDACPVGSRCSSDTLKCEALLIKGDYCSNNDECGIGLVCASYFGACDKRAITGSPCNDDDECINSEYCDTYNPKSVCFAPIIVKEKQRCDGYLLICDEGLYCNNNICYKKKGIGLTCTDNGECEIGLYCSPKDRVCTKLVSIGDKCSFSGQCEANAYCDLWEQKCVEKKKKDEDCESTEECADGLRCITYKCKSLDEQGKDAPCRSNNDCKSGYYCNKSSYSCYPRIEIGNECDPYNDICIEGSWCDPDSSTCVIQGKEGEVCKNDKSCASGFICRSFLGTCKSKVSEGHDCTQNKQCLDGLNCVPKEICKERLNENESCYYTFECKDGFICDPEWFVCYAPKENLGRGERCLYNRQCSSGMCSENGFCIDACVGTR